MSMFDDLAAPFPPEAIHWRAQMVLGHRALALAYLDARDVMDRLDAVCGPENWRDDYSETPRGRVLCRLSIRVGEEWITKADAAGDTAVEGEKGGVSDALKRAAVKWGIGRYLYRLKSVWAPCEIKAQGDKNVWKAWANDAPAIFANALAGVAQEEVKEPAHSALKSELREFVRELEGCGDWGTFTAFRETKDFKRLTKECADKLPQWWSGGPEMAAEFVPLKRRIELMEVNLQEKENA